MADHAAAPDDREQNVSTVSAHRENRIVNRRRVEPD
jgi:hypothetical protein